MHIMKETAWISKFPIKINLYFNFIFPPSFGSLVHPW